MWNLLLNTEITYKILKNGVCYSEIQAARLEALGHLESISGWSADEEAEVRVSCMDDGREDVNYELYRGVPRGVLRVLEHPHQIK